jgi:hypothetical protein
MNTKQYEKMIESKESESFIVATCIRSNPTYAEPNGHLITWIVPKYR